MEARPIPEAFLCPITLEMMREPVVDNMGHSYEREAILACLAKKAESPITRQPLAPEQLHTNYALRDLIQEFQQQQQQVGAVAPVAMEVDPDPVGSMKLTSQVHGGNVLVRIQPPPGEARTPSVLVCVVDCSGSTEMDVVIKDAQGKESGDGLCVLDLIKHSLQTIIATLNADDVLAIVAFHNQARVLLAPCAMDAANKMRARAAVETLLPQGSTNIWDGLLHGFQLVRDIEAREQRNVATLLLTDGFPNISPPRGEASALRMFLAAQQIATCRLDTIGFGYDINSRLLQDLALAGNSGTYSFIPDGAMVGTVMIHAVSNILATCALRAQLRFESYAALGDKHGPALVAWLKNLYGDDAVSEDAVTKSVALDMGSVRYGIDKTLVLPVGYIAHPNDAGAEAFAAGCADSLSLRMTWTDPKTRVARFLRAQPDVLAEEDYVSQHLVRMTMVRTINECLAALGTPLVNTPVAADRLVRAQELAATFRDRIGAILAKHPGGLMAGMHREMDDQVIKAVATSEAYTRWGQHYLPALARAHLNQHVANFKDPGAAHYTGALFSKLRDEMDLLFVTLPAPVPINQQPAAAAAAAQAAPVAINMDAYNDQEAGCFSADSELLMADGKTRRKIATIVPGDQVATPGGGAASVRYVLRMKLASDKGQTLCRLAPGIALTPWHPIQLADGSWEFPAKLVDTPIQGVQAVLESTLLVPENRDYVYNIALDQHHIVLAGSSTSSPIACVTLAHGFSAANVQHDFFGTNRVLTAYNKVAATGSASDKGVRLEIPANTRFTRDPVTQLIDGIELVVVV